LKFSEVRWDFSESSLESFKSVLTSSRRITSEYL
jgi:hypothetical protein